jgi:hypothetical protein
VGMPVGESSRVGGRDAQQEQQIPVHGLRNASVSAAVDEVGLEVIADVEIAHAWHCVGSDHLRSDA